jgi:hypothetical protein
MEELFRFAVVRPVTKSTPNIIPLTMGPLDPTTGRPTISPFLTAITQLVASLSANGGFSKGSWGRLLPTAVSFVVKQGSGIVADATWMNLTGLVQALQALAVGPTPAAAIDATAIQQVFAQYPTLAAQGIWNYQSSLTDLFVALMIVRQNGPSAFAGQSQDQAVLLCSRPTLPEIAQLIAAGNIVANGPAALAPPAGLTAEASQTVFAASLKTALTATINIPTSIIPAVPRPTLGVGFRELHVVRQNIRRYEAAEIGQIENILQGESRSHTQRHDLSTETDTTITESTTTVTDKELTTTDHTDIKNETQSQVNSATKIDAGVHAQYSGPSFKLQADLNVSYAHSDDETKQYSADTAKDITQKAASTVTQVVSRTQETKIIESFRETEKHSFDNSKGAKNISGIYQWINKVYLSQVFNLGRHMLIDITVPEPAANLIALATSTPVLDPPPIQPHPLGTIKMSGGAPVKDPYGRLQLDMPLNPLDLSPNALTPLKDPNPNFYGTWVAYYGATGVTPPPVAPLTFSKSEIFAYKDDDNKELADQIEVADGYGATIVNVSISALRNDNPGKPLADNVYVEIAIGGTTLHMPWPGSSQSSPLTGKGVLDPPATGDVNFTIYGRNISQMSVDITLVCYPMNVLLDQWRLQTYEKIVSAYTNLQQTYDAAMAARKMETQTVGPLGSDDTDQNRLIERLELKRSCIAIFDNDNSTVAGNEALFNYSPPPGQQPDPPVATNPVLPEPVLDTSQSLGARVRWFEQAFEWENMAYVNYPYFWGRRSRWVSDLNISNVDPLFVQFLKAGYARVVVPVRLGFAAAVHHYLCRGQPWLGGDLPPVGDDRQNPLYLDIAEEIKNDTGGGYSGEIETPIGDPWEYTLPTTLMLLKDDATLPEWHRVSPPEDASDPAYASNAPDGPWTWQPGPPPATAASDSIASPNTHIKRPKRALKSTKRRKST